jgi:hypothetical protein
VSQKARELGLLEMQNLRRGLLDILASLLAVSLASQRFLSPLLFTRLEIERMSFNLFDDVFLLDLSLESPQGALQGFTVLDIDFRQLKSPPHRRAAHPSRASAALHPS